MQKFFFFSFLCFLVYTTHAQNETGSLTDVRDGQVYSTVKIDGVWWMSQNLNFATENSWWYDEKKENGDIYGRLYTWQDAQKACPEGWRLPGEQDWVDLLTYLGMTKEEAMRTGWRGDSLRIGSKLKSNSPLWTIRPNDTITASGFNAFPAGYRKHAVVFFFIHKISFKGLGNNAAFWTSEKDGRKGYYRYLDSNKNSVFRYRYFREAGFSVRCVEAEQ